MKQGRANPAAQQMSASAAGTYTEARPPGWANYRPRERVVPMDLDVVETPVSREVTTGSTRSAIGNQRSQHFNWNGHSWNAFEVLGLSADASAEKAMLAFQAASGCCDAESVAFLRAAYDIVTGLLSS